MSSTLPKPAPLLSRGQIALLTGLLIAIVVAACMEGHQNAVEAVKTAVSDSTRIAFDTASYTAAAATPENTFPELVVNKEDIARLSKLVTFKKDDFQDVTWIQPKSRPSYESGMYCYFAKEAGRPTNFRFVIRYYADEWLFIKHYEFMIDGEHYSYYPDKVDQDNGSGSIWEWTDQHVSGEDVKLIRALAFAKNAKMRIVGSQYVKDKTVTTAQIKSIREMLQLYSGMGGAL